MEQSTNIIIIKIRKYFESVITAGMKNREDLDLLRRVRLLNLLAITAIIILIIMSVVVFFEGKPHLSVINMTGATIFFLLRLDLKKTGNYSRASLGGMNLSFIFLLYFFITGGNAETGHVWSFIFPILASFLMGSKRGLVISLIYITIVIVSGFFNFHFQADYSFAFRIRFAFSLFTLSLLSFYISFLSENNIKKHTNTNIHLKKVVVGLKQTELQLIAAKENAEKSSKAKSEFLRNMSHELRTPLNHIIGFSQLMQDGIPGSINNTQNEYLGDILDSSSHLLSLINDLLDIARIESGKVELSPEAVDLSKLIRETLEIYQTKAANKKFQMIFNSGIIPETIIADKRKIIQILHNLLSNAVKFSNEEGLVIISTKTDSTKNEVVISIKDTGIGIEEENMNLIFDSFGQVESDVTRKFDGTGLGLALTKNLVELHGGRIWAESDGLGKGSTFNFSIPVIKQIVKIRK